MNENMKKFLCAFGLLLLTACKPGLPDSLKMDGKPIDPICFSVIGGQRVDYIPLKNCGQGLTVEERSSSDRSTYMAAYKYTELEDGGVGMSMPYSEYSYIGSYENKDLIRVNWSGGGTGHFSVLMYVSREGDELRIHETITGGDRCNGGLVDASVTKDGLISISQNVTPFDMIVISGDPDRPLLKTLKPYEDLETCAICCYGVAHYTDHVLQSVTVNAGVSMDKSYENLSSADHQKQICFDKLLSEKTSNREKTFSAAEWDKFVHYVEAGCLEPIAP